MNSKDAKRLMRLHSYMSQVPFPISGVSTRTSTVTGFVDYTSDMRSIQPAFMSVLFGMACEKNTKHGWYVGEDFDDPDILLDVIQEWLDMRNEQKWENSTSYSFFPFWEKARDKMRECNDEQEKMA